MWQCSIFLKKISLLVSILLLSFLYTTPVSAAVFKCTTASGETIYSSKKCEGQLEPFNLKEEHHIKHAALQSSEKGTNKPTVDIYITSWCPYCKKAMAYLQSKNIAFNAYDIEKNAKAKAKKQKLASGYTGVPLTIINGKILKGFSENRFEKALSL